MQNHLQIIWSEAGKSVYNPVEFDVFKSLELVYCVNDDSRENCEP